MLQPLGMAPLGGGLRDAVKNEAGAPPPTPQEAVNGELLIARQFHVSRGRINKAQ